MYNHNARAAAIGAEHGELGCHDEVGFGSLLEGSTFEASTLGFARPRRRQLPGQQAQPTHCHTRWAAIRYQCLPMIRPSLFLLPDWHQESMRARVSWVCLCACSHTGRQGARQAGTCDCLDARAAFLPEVEDVPAERAGRRQHHRLLLLRCALATSLTGKGGTKCFSLPQTVE